MFELQRVVSRSASNNGDNASTLFDAASRKGAATARAMACWDPTYPGEKIDWYGEYRARHAPVSIGWLQQPVDDASGSREKLETRGLGLLKNFEDSIVLAPLDDGSVCLWGIGHDGSEPGTKNGTIMTRSRPGLLSVNGPNGSTWQCPTRSRAKMSNTSIVECVSVDKVRNRAYFAVQSGLNEVDLTTLQISSYDRYPLPISTLSEAQHPTPLTVGTTLSLHLHDPRLGNNGRSSSYTYITDQVDDCSSLDGSTARQSDFHRLQLGDPDSTSYATLFQPAPLSILHLSHSSSIYVAGRFPSILTYDRRNFPKLASTIHSGARLSSLASLPSPGHPTLAAAGEYNGKGSLELYPLMSPRDPWISSEPTRNRTSASSSKLLSLTPHGTRLLFSDGGGQLKWVERDGSTLVRRWNINNYSTSPNDLSQTTGIFNNDPNQGDVAMKLLPTGHEARSEVCVWTGEKIGVLSFEKNPRVGGDRALDADGEGEGGEEIEERDFGRMMRRALERQADEVRFVRGLGLGA